MEKRIIAIYCLCHDFLKAINHYEDPQRKINDAEVMTTAFVAMIFFSGNFEKARNMLNSKYYIPDMISKSRFNRRIHNIKEHFLTLFQIVSCQAKKLDKNLIYSIDSFPISVCDNYRIKRCKIYKKEKYRGYISSKKRYFYGLRIHVLINKKGIPIEFFIAPASVSDVKMLKAFSFDLPKNSIIYGDKAYNDYELEDLLKEALNVKLLPMRKKNSKRKLPPYIEYIQHYYRKAVETTGSLIEKMLPKSIHAVTKKGFELKIALFVIALTVNLYL